MRSRHAALPPGASSTLRALAAALLVLLAVGAAPAADGVVVVLGGYNLHPSDVAVAVGEPVTFQVQAREDAATPHTVVGVGGGFRSPPLEAGETWSLSFDAPGVYRYRLEERPSVEGTIVVE